VGARVVLDPFGGAGTVGMVADRMHRHSVLLYIDERSAAMSKARIDADAKMFANVEVA
jgi:DNA modification methylase